jgi:hypothetical protein
MIADGIVKTTPAGAFIGIPPNPKVETRFV